MADMDDVRDELFRASGRIIGRGLTDSEESALLEAYNRQKSGSIFEKCARAIEEVFNVDLGGRELIEKAASVDRVRNAIANLRALAARSVK